MKPSRFSRIGMSRLAARALFGGAALAVVGTSSDARAQLAGTTSRPLPNVLLLVDSSGSMERMTDNSLPSASAGNTCAPGSSSNPNRWGMLLQALTGNLQPYYSCDAIDRSSAAFKNEFSINGKTVYDANYSLPYHRPLTGATSGTACTLAPYTLPGAASGSGVGVGKRGAGGNASDFPANAFAAVNYSHLKSQFAGGSDPSFSANACTFEQAGDGQLDATRDYIRYALMMFDNDPSAATGLSSTSIDTSNPFTGQWSYLKTSGNTLFSATGTPAGCTDPSAPYTYELGARHASAPPWEGRLVGFPGSDSSLYDMATVNENIQKVLLGSRPYGATPIAGMLEDARDYLWFNPSGPKDDPYVAGGCREEFIILLTDGAPNLDLRPSCEGTGGSCPFNKAADIVGNLAASTEHTKVKTFVIGFSVNGTEGTSADGFPTGVKSCKAWYTGAGKGTPTGMLDECASAKPAAGTTASACCQLNEVAYWGTEAHDVGPYFAETQADLVLSFGRILGTVAKTASTRTLPGYSPTVTINNVGNSASYVASFIPNARRVWSGEIDRTRTVCDGTTPKAQTQAADQGDSYAANLAAQAVAGNRLFISVTAPKLTGTVLDSSGTVRPYASATPTDGIAASIGAEVAALDDGLNSTTNWAEALDITSSTCKRSKAVVAKATVDVPALSKTDCTTSTWDFATAHYGAVKPSGSTYDFNVRCSASGGSGIESGTCSISGTSCKVASTTDCGAGEICVPNCSALGAIFRSSPALVGPPNQFLRDDAYLSFSAAHAGRRTAMYVASADGVLHAFKALANKEFDPVKNNDVELWAFVPPAVLPKLASNYPSGQQILLDGTPVVKDTVWDRKAADTTAANQFHSTLVAGMGSGGAGYYALDVSDPDCGGITNTAGCQGSGKFTVASTKSDAGAGNKGPHFLWQLTDFPKGATETAKISRTRGDGTKMVALFGKESGTPAITTLQVDPGDSGGARQIGVAILPGGIDGAPVAGGSCSRRVGGTGFSASDYDFSDSSFARRTSVRKWAASCDDPVPGRGVTIVRLDTGEILRHFGRKAQDVPTPIAGKTTDSPFDSPVIGTPVVYPNLIGATAQKVFVGDADGTVWRIDLSSSDPASWKVTLFQDLLTGATAAASQPINVPMVLSLDTTGGIVLNAATGDQENLVASSEKNYLFSVQEQRPTTSGTPGAAKVKWYKEFTNAERVTGPLTVFDRTLYFATYTPAVPKSSDSCSNAGTPTLWGMDFFNAAADAGKGGAARWCPLGEVDATSGTCKKALVQSEDPTASADFAYLKGAIIPGVTIRATQSCATFDASSTDPTLTGMSTTSFELFFGATTARSGGAIGTPQSARASVARPLPRTTARVDSWALLTD